MSPEATPTEEGSDMVDEETMTLDLFVQAMAHTTLTAYRMEDFSVGEIANILDRFLAEHLSTEDPRWEPLMALGKLYLIGLEMMKIDFELDGLLGHGKVDPED
ncbi:MAG: hypothetical protein OXQ32_08265 [bacterium]|nr:hypothetical protein [bacterium]